MKVFLARQPIFDEHLNVIAYELLYRAGEKSVSAEIEDANLASKEVIVNAFSEIGVDNITGGRPALINITEDILVNGELPKGLQKHLIPEILEDVLIQPKVISEVKTLIDVGYRIALDDFEYSAEWKPLVDMAHFIKLDVLNLGVKGTEEQVRLLRENCDIEGKLLAEKVETREEFEHYKALGFSYFQGYFLCKPSLMGGARIPSSGTVLLSLLAELSTEDYDISQVERIIRNDPRLSYKLLRVVNSASFGLARTISQIRDAIVILGAIELRRWASMLAITAIDGGPDEVVVTAIVRARMCEVLAMTLDRPQEGCYFTVGLLSLLDALFNRPLSDIVDGIPLSPEIKGALLHYEGELGAALEAVISYETGDFDGALLDGVTADQYSTIYLQCLVWADNMLKQIKGV